MIMNKTRIWLIAGLSLTISGLIICALSFNALGRDFSRLSTVRYETNTYEAPGTFSSLSIHADTEDIELLPSTDGHTKVVCHEDAKYPHRTQIQSDTLIINRPAHPGIRFGVVMDRETISVYLPAATYDKLVIDSDTGDVEIPADFSFMELQIDLDTGDLDCLAGVNGLLQVTSDTGDIDLADLKAGDLRLTTTTGDVRLTNVISAGSMQIETDTGDVRFDGSDAMTITVRTDTGDVTGTLRSAKTFVTNTDTGAVDVPQAGNGGNCEIRTDTGDIRISIQ